jgi:hypothetical protein
VVKHWANHKEKLGNPFRINTTNFLFWLHGSRRIWGYGNKKADQGRLFVFAVLLLRMRFAGRHTQF